MLSTLFFTHNMRCLWQLIEWKIVDLSDFSKREEDDINRGYFSSLKGWENISAQGGSGVVPIYNII